MQPLNFAGDLTEFMTATQDPIITGWMSSANAHLELKDIIKTLPKECFQKDRRKAWSFLLTSVAAASVGYIAIATLPWFFLPIAWIFTGTALTGWFVVAHDCGHRSFAQRRWVNDLVGHIMILPSLYPFHCWRILHAHHHRHTNKLGEDNAWQPWTIEKYLQATPTIRFFYRGIRGRFWWTASLVHSGSMHFTLASFAKRDHAKATFSIAMIAIFVAVLFPALYLTVGAWGIVKFWLMPWLVYHFWMSTFTLVHHTNMNNQFRPSESWSAAEAQLAGTVHCVYPRWVEILCHDINVHIPHHVSVAIPSYNLRMAHQALKQRWGSHMQECEFSLELMQDIVEQCHVYDSEKVYQSFRTMER